MKRLEKIADLFLLSPSGWDWTNPKTWFGRLVKLAFTPFIFMFWFFGVLFLLLIGLLFCAAMWVVTGEQNEN